MYITPAELRMILNNLGEELAPEEVEELIAEARADGNGKINYREFMTMMLSEAT
jgi:calmodulin